MDLFIIQKAPPIQTFTPHNHLRGWNRQKCPVIRTIVTIIRKIFQRNDSCYVCAPTGSAAFQAGGKTIHSLFGVNIRNIQDSIGPTLKTRLEKQFSNIVALIIDERSMLSSELISTMENHARETFYSGINSSKPWGGIPILILVGDDFQLPPVDVGAFDALSPIQDKESSLSNRNEKRSQRISHGESLFVQAGKDVMSLHITKRVLPSQQCFRNILNGLRSSGSSKLTDDDIHFLATKFHLMSPHFSDHDQNFLTRDALFLFANRAPRDLFNRLRLHETHSTSNPVAKIQSTHEEIWGIGGQQLTLR